jgi:hypothetical protein
VTETPSTELVGQDVERLVDLLLGTDSLEDILLRFAKEELPTEESATPTAVVVPALSEPQRTALARLPEVYGKVAPSRPRPLTQPELVALHEERRLLAVIGDLVEQRKSAGIREVVASHLDKVAERDGRARPEPEVEFVGGEPHVVAEATPRDAAGHYLLDGEAPVPGTGEKFTRELRGGGLEFSSRALHAALKAGDITRAQYNALTVQPVLPPPPREFDEATARRSIAADPSLALALARYGTVPKKKTSAINVRKDK